MTSDLSILDMLPTLFRTIPAVQQGLNGVNLGPSAQTVSDLNQLAKAGTNQNSPLFQSMLAQNKQAGNANLASTIAQLQAQNRLAVSSGQSPLLSQERGGEGIFRNLVQGQQDVGNAALGQTYGQIQQGEEGLTGSLKAQNDLAGAQYGNAQKQTAAYGTIGDALQGLFGLGNKQQQQAPTQESSSMKYLMGQQPAYNNSNYTTPVSQSTLLPQNGGYISNG